MIIKVSDELSDEFILDPFSSVEITLDRYEVKDIYRRFAGAEDGDQIVIEGGLTFKICNRTEQEINEKKV